MILGISFLFKFLNSLNVMYQHEYLGITAKLIFLYRSFQPSYSLNSIHEYFKLVVLNHTQL